MENNDILRRIRYIFDFNDSKMMNIFDLANSPATREEISNWLKKDVDPDWKEINDFNLAAFLNGLIILHRGKKEGPQPEPEKKLNNNIILRKLKIALQLKDEDIIEFLQLADMKFSKHEISAFFRNPRQSQYRECKDQILRNVLQGMRLKYRDSKLL